MKDSDIHLRAIMTVHIGIANPLEHIQSFLHLTEDCVLSRKREDIGLGECDEKIAIVKIGSTVGGHNKTDFIDLPLHINLVSVIGLVKSALLPDGCRLLRSNFGNIICVRRGILFWISAKRALL
jgi:hypothetical protein